jgi:hypothetical protein
MPPNGQELARGVGPGWVATYATTFPGVRLAAGKTLSDCSRLRKGALQIYRFDTEALDG